MSTVQFALIGASGLGAFLTLHVIAWRMLRQERKTVVNLTISAVAGYGVAIVAARYLLDLPFVSHGPVSLPVFLFLAVLYFHLYYGVDRSVSLRILGTLAYSARRELSPAELDAAYPREEMFERRFQIMVLHGLLTETGGVFRCTDKGRRLARIARWGRFLYGNDATG